MASPFTVTLATQWIVDGTALDMLNAIRNESRARQAIASRVLEAWPYEAHPDGFHLWLPVPVESGWSASELALQLRNQGIAAVAGAAFSTDGNPPNAMRVCLGGSKTRDECEAGAAHRRGHTRTSASSAFAGDVKRGARLYRHTDTTTYNAPCLRVISASTEKAARSGKSFSTIPCTAASGFARKLKKLKAFDAQVCAREAVYADEAACLTDYGSPLTPKDSRHVLLNSRAHRRPVRRYRCGRARCQRGSQLCRHQLVQQRCDQQQPERSRSRPR